MDHSVSRIGYRFEYMGKKRRNKGFFKFNCGRFIVAVLVAVILTGYTAYKIDHIDMTRFTWDVEDDVKFANLNYIASVICDDKSFVDEAQSGSFAFDYINFSILNSDGSTTEVYKSEYNFSNPELAGAKALYNTRYMLCRQFYIPDSKIVSFLTKPEYNTRPDVVISTDADDADPVPEDESEYSLLQCRAVNSLYAKGAADVRAVKKLSYGSPVGNIWYYSGILAADGHEFKYEYVAAYKDYLETSAVYIVILFVILLILCLTVACLSGIRQYHKYIAEMNNKDFKNGLIDALAHNLKTPMQIITLNAENLKDRPSPERRKHYTDAILSRAKVMNEMTVSINQATHGEPVISTFSVKEAVLEAAAKLDVVLEITDDSKIKADRDYFIQAVYNLLDNAASYSPEGSVITVENKPRKMIISNPAKQDRFTPGTGIAIADRFLTKNGMLLSLELKDGVFKAVIEYGFY